MRAFPLPRGLPYQPVMLRRHPKQRSSRVLLYGAGLCQTDPAFQEALRRRVASAERFAAFMHGASSYIAPGRPCAKCGDFRKRTRDRSCYGCHLRRSKENFERMKSGMAPVVSRSQDSHLDLLKRQRAARNGEHLTRSFGDLVAMQWPMGRLEITFPDGWHEADLSKLSLQELINAIGELPALRDALDWAGWKVPYAPTAQNEGG